jgi:pantoate--beta-alanine ligase
MKIISSIQTIKRILAPMHGKKRIGLVPTMGAFHEGHLSLLRAAQRESDYQVVSLFVNPLQFGPTEDFNRYPRDLPSDQAWAATHGVDLLFTPAPNEIVPSDIDTVVSVPSLSRRWEGASRPDHFQGVATIVTKLFQIVRPDVAYFGQKDYQQVAVIQQLVRDLHFDLKIRVMPTIREKDGLAKSSRNQLLSPEDRAAATVLYRALHHAKQSVKGGARDCRILEKKVALILKKERRADLDYVAFCDPKTLEPVRLVTGKTVILLAVRMGSIRLIANLVIR